MSNALQCDVCECLYLHNDSPKPLVFKENPNYNVASIHVKQGNKRIDVCKSCMKEFAELLSGFYSEENNEFNFIEN